MKRVIFAVAAAMAFASASSSADSVHWKGVPGWDIYMDPSMGNGCYVVTGYRDGTFLRLGFNFLKAKAEIYFALGNANWKSLEIGKDYPVEIQFDKNPVWTATATAISVGDTNYISISTTDTNFANEFARKLTVRARFQGKEIAALRLKGSAAAIREFLECQKAVNAMTAKSPAPQPAPKDPFQTTPDIKTANDPFDL